jgi:hypothetical protein
MGEDLQKNGDEREEARRPTPVRMVMEGGSEAEATKDDRARVFHDEDTGSDWRAILTGWSASGILPLRTVPLVELTFSKAETPEEPLRRALCRGEGLGEMSDSQLLEALRNSEPFRPPMREAESTGEKGGKARNRRGPQS